MDMRDATCSDIILMLTKKTCASAGGVSCIRWFTNWQSQTSKILWGGMLWHVQSPWSQRTVTRTTLLATSPTSTHCCGRYFVMVWLPTWITTTVRMFTCGCKIRWHSHQRLVAWPSGVVMVNYSATPSHDTGWVNWKYGMASAKFMATNPLDVAMICAGWIWPTSWPSSSLRTAYGMVVWWDLSFKMLSTSGWCFCFPGQLAVFCWITSLSSADSTIRTGGNLLWLSNQSKAF